MKLFGFFKKKETETFFITEADRLWVENNFRWLIKVFGYPNPDSQQIVFSKKYFENIFQADGIFIENIIKDLCSLFHIQESKVSFALIKDIRDSNGMPYIIEGTPFETKLEICETNYKVIIANILLKQPRRLIYRLVYEFIRIKLNESKLQYDTGTDTNLFIYLAGIYFGFGVILSQNLRDTGMAYDGYWETKWNYISEMPNEIMAFALATYAKLIQQETPTWKNDIPSDLKILFEKAQNTIHANPSEFYDKNEIEANALFKNAHELYQKNQFREAFDQMHKILLLTKDEIMLTDVYNNLGYYHIRLKEYELSINYFNNSIQITPEYGYANDNLAYALILLGRLEEGKTYLEKALKTANNDIAYTYRNFGLYYDAIGDEIKAESFFKKSFNAMKDSVDLLEYHYAEFLIKNGDKEKGLIFLTKAAEKGEREAIEKMLIIKNHAL